MARKSHEATVVFDGGEATLILGKYKPDKNNPNKTDESVVRAIAFDSDWVQGSPITWAELEKKPYVKKLEAKPPGGKKSGDEFCILVGGQWICLE